MIKAKPTAPQNDETQKETKEKHRSIVSIITWVIAVLMILLMSASLYQYLRGQSLLELINLKSEQIGSDNSNVVLPTYAAADEYQSVKRDANADTVLPTGYRKEPVSYTVAPGDSIFGIAQSFDLEPESVLWANYDVLNDDPHLISVGQDLVIPPVDGILYEWKEGDTLDKVAAKYYVDVDDILLFPGNDLDMTNPTIEPGTLVMIPGGYREYETWVVPSVASSDAGVNSTILGPGGCSTSSGGSVGTYTFIWPTPYRVISGNDYWSGHQALDMMCYLGDAIFASDSGVVVYAGAISGGYGNLVMIDHGNGYQTLYAHLSTINVSCGQNVYQGQVIGGCGSTGNSTGPHLHFEIRMNGGMINPWLVLQ
ncbi:MAG: LysM peptidoglycan-binding domain-containing protein [Anaerolineaceae bacterium]|nr:MAG: LysM peptidoglycan-binding domain-containing protein [Anaerolineaceae bacterium]